MFKILQTEHPIITSFGKFAHFFSVAGQSSSNLLWVSKHWLLPYAYEYCNPPYAAIDLSGYAKLSYMDNSHLSTPCLDVNIISSHLTGFDDILEAIKCYIDNDDYVCIWVNCSSLTDIYPGWSIDHQVLVYGYDTNSSILYIKDFFPSSMVYRENIIQMSDFVYAHNAAQKKQIILYHRKDTIDLHLYISKFIENMYHSAKHIYLCDYNIVNPYYIKTERLTSVAVGINIYDSLIAHSELYGLKGMHALYDAKKLFQHCLHYVVSHGLLSIDIYNDYCNFVNALSKARYIYIKYDLKSNRGFKFEQEESIFKVILKEAQSTETRLLLEMIDYWDTVAFS